MIRAALVALSILGLAACASNPAPHALAGSYPEASPFAEGADAAADLASAQAMAASEGKRVLAVFGANWCHDSRALAGWLQSPRLAALVDANFAVVYIDAGVPQTGEGRNLALAAGHGVTNITGTPTLLVLTADGSLLNTPEDARSWRNAASRSEDEIFAFLQRWTASQ